MHVHPEAAALQPELILKALLRNRVNCVIVGSFGAIAQGVDLEYTDIDLCIDMSAEKSDCGRPQRTQRDRGHG